MTQIDQNLFYQACQRLRVAINWSREPEAHGSPGELLDQNRMALNMLEALGNELFEREAAAGVEADGSGEGETEAVPLRSTKQSGNGKGQEKVGELSDP